ncbi:MAG: hypothetical protein IT445_16890 [Phycisphaeraceae bacterium]|nr:hypothetical protein [Phycisphaeraceae bacterium]
MRRMLLASMLIAAVAGLSAMSWAAVGDQRPAELFNLHVHSLVVQPGPDGQPARTIFRDGTGQAVVDGGKMSLIIDTLENGDDSVAFDPSELNYHPRVRVFAGPGAATVTIDGVQTALDVKQVMRVRISRAGPFVRGIIAGKTEDGSVKLLTGVRGRAAWLNSE